MLSTPMVAALSRSPGALRGDLMIFFNTLLTISDQRISAPFAFTAQSSYDSFHQLPNFQAGLSILAIRAQFAAPFFIRINCGL